MATSFPTTLDTFTNPASTDALNKVGVTHASQHININDAVAALETKVGIDGSAVSTSLDKLVSLRLTAISVATANGVSGTSSGGTTPALTLSLGAITPSSVVASGTVTGSNLSGTHSGTSSGTNTGDQTSVSGSSGSCTGNSATATALQTARTINGVSFDGTANVTVTASGATLTGRLSSTGGTAITTGDVALGAGWGANATVTAVTGNDSHGTITVTTSMLDTPLNVPQLTLTFKDGAWSSAPFAVVNMNDQGSGVMAAVSCSTTTTTLSITYIGTPTALLAKTYIFNYMVIG